MEGRIATILVMGHPQVIAVRGLRHLALKVRNLRRSKDFYVNLFGLRVVWEPDEENVYLSSGCDNLALHQVSLAHSSTPAGQSLDHFGFIVECPEEVDRAAQLLQDTGIPLLQSPRTHRDGSRSLSLQDPDGNVIQILYEPHISPVKIS